MLSGVSSALFMARRIQAGLAANIRPSSTNRMPKPMRKSANAMDLIGLKPPVMLVYLLSKGDVSAAPHFGPYGFGPGGWAGAAADAAALALAAAAGLPLGLPKNLKKSESG